MGVAVPNKSLCFNGLWLLRLVGGRDGTRARPFSRNRRALTRAGAHAGTQSGKGVRTCSAIKTRRLVGTPHRDARSCRWVWCDDTRRSSGRQCGNQAGQTAFASVRAPPINSTRQRDTSSRRQYRPVGVLEIGEIAEVHVQLKSMKSLRRRSPTRDIPRRATA